MDQRGVAGLRLPHTVDQVMRRHALEHGGGRHLLRNALGDRHQPVRRCDQDLRVGAGHRRPRHSVALPNALGAGADGLHDSRALEPENERSRSRVEAGAHVDVDEVDAAGRDVDANASRAGLSRVVLIETQHLGAPGFVDEDGLRHAGSLARRSQQSTPQSRDSRITMGISRSVRSRYLAKLW
jgi:hypothetical protein